MPIVVPKATFVNMFAIAIGGTIGILFHNYYTSDLQNIVFQAVGLGILLIGIKMVLRLPEGYLLFIIFGLIFGGLIGVLIGLESKVNSLTEIVQAKIKNDDALFSEGMITAFLLFCVGSMTIVGALEEGLQQKRELLYSKSLLDGFTSIALANTYGIGVIFSIVPLFLFQGSITIFSHQLRSIFSPKILDSISAVGGLLILGISINLLKIGHIPLITFLPSLVIVTFFTYLYHLRYEKSL